MRIPAAAVALAILLAGCSGSSGDDSSSSAGTTTGAGTSGGSGGTTGSSPTGSTTSGAGQNAPPTAELGASVTSGFAPLLVNFTVQGTDADSRNLTYSLDLGAGTPLTGTVPAKPSHTFTAAGNFTVVLTVSDGTSSARDNVTVRVLAAPPAGATQADSDFEGSVTCAPLIGLVTDTGSIEESTHDLTVNPGQTRLTLTLAYAEDPSGQDAIDLDLFVTDPAGTETVSNAAGPEPPLVIENPLAGAWELRVHGWSCAGTQDYTLNAQFG